MKLVNNPNDSTCTIRSYNEEGIHITENNNDKVLVKSFIIMPDQIIKNWQPDDLSELGLNDLELIIDLDPEIFILGTGNSLSFPEMSLTSLVTSKNIGFEVMDTYAACRCYSILVSEGRNVAAGMILEKG